VVVLKNGAVEEEGPPAKLLADPTSEFFTIYEAERRGMTL